ncbi:hypothetical protein [Methylobacterium sp. J-070]|uniref:hypothetical protein n=1 Tax=Methylobacterium sp. J-070 TaxID=2836650 RepID=UPI001FBB0300|nr:hypothetical protein [Methylobacterium sp. J-070]MCJ2049214.1 hypothetical protein [Methylobacterium sp. J-070]
MFALENRSPTTPAVEGACIVGRAVDGMRAFDRWEVVEAFAMFAREGALPVWKVAGRHAHVMPPGPPVPGP